MSSLVFFHMIQTKIPRPITQATGNPRVVKSVVIALMSTLINLLFVD